MEPNFQTPPETDGAPSLRAIFLVFLKMGAFAFGGVYSMLSFFQRELVERRGWVTQDDFTEAVAVGQMTPGPPIINTGIFIGYRLRGPKGAFAATAGQVLPGFLLVLVMGYLYVHYRHIPTLGPILKGVGAAVVGLLASVVYRLSTQLIKGWEPALFALSGFAALHFLHINPIFVIMVSGALGYAIYGRRK